VTPEQVVAGYHLHPGFESVVLRGGSVEGIIGDILLVGERTGRSSRARELAGSIERRLDELKTIAESRVRGTPRVLVLEWIDPPIAAGHLVPEMVEIAGGEPVASKPGEESRVLEWEEITSLEPDVIVFAACGWGVDETIYWLERLKPPACWPGMKAVREKNVWVVDAKHYFSRPGPRIVEGVGILLGVLGARGVVAGLEARRAAPWLGSVDRR
jgi:iron complex transport system substrate-binding protein